MRAFWNRGSDKFGPTQKKVEKKFSRLKTVAFESKRRVLGVNLTFRAAFAMLLPQPKTGGKAGRGGTKVRNSGQGRTGAVAAGVTFKTQPDS